MIPENFTLSPRISMAGDDWTDIEMRSEKEKYTIATVEDRFADLFLALPDLLTALKRIADIASCAPHDDEELASQEFAKILQVARDAIRKTKGE